PAACVSRAARTTWSTDICATPGIELIGRLTSRPGQTKKGWIRSSGARRVSRIIRRSVSVRRSRRGRLIGNAIGILTPSRAELGTEADYIDDKRRNETALAGAS